MENIDHCTRTHAHTRCSVCSITCDTSRPQGCVPLAHVSHGHCLRGERRGDMYGGNVARTASVTVMPLCRGTRMTHMLRDRGTTERGVGRDVFFNYCGCFHLNPGLHIDVKSHQFQLGAFLISVNYTSCSL